MGDKKAQVLLLDPPVDLVFKGPFTEVVTSQLTLQNPSNEQVIFKVKTTAPKQYCVRPNSGLLKPQEMATISVMLQPFEHSSADKSKHKFMVQTMFAPQGFKVESLDAVWKDANKSQLMDSKLRCVFLDDDETGGAAGGVAGSTTQNQAAISESTTTESGIKVDAPATPKQEEELPPAVPSPSNVGSGNTAGSNFQSNAGSTPAHVAPAAKEMEKATVESKVRMLQDKIDLLSSENAQLKSEGNKLRQRIGPGATASASLTAGSPMRAPPQKQGSLSLLAIMLILVAIILGYLVGKWL